jgi:hypothetical protein
MGFMLETEAPEFIKNMGLKTDKNAVFVPVCSDDINLPSALDIPLTITKSTGAVRVDTHFSSALPKSAFGKILDGESLHIDNWDTWSVDGKDAKVAVITSWEIY